MAPVRISAPAYTTRRRRRFSASPCRGTCPDVVISTRSPEVECSTGCNLHTVHGDADDSLKHALLGAKEEHEEEEHDVEKWTQAGVSQFSSPSRTPHIGRDVYRTEKTSSHISAAERNFLMKEAQESELFPARGSIGSGGALDTVSLHSVSPAAALGVTTAKPEGSEKDLLQKAPLKMPIDHKIKCSLVTGNLSRRSGERPPSEMQSTLEKSCSGSTLLSIPTSALNSKALINTSDHPVEELSTAFIEELAKKLSTEVPDKVVFPEGATAHSEENRPYNRRHYSSLLSTRLPVKGLGDASSRETSPDATSVQREFLDENGAEDGSGERTIPDPHSLTPAEKLMGSGAKSEVVSCRGESYADSLLQKARQDPASSPLNTLSSSTAHVRDCATSTADDGAPSRGPGTPVQQNATALIKRRRCGSLGLDQSLRWQALARRVPRIKGVCYSTTRHEWIAVGPLQAGSARKKNIYFSVPKHGFDGARRLAVECRRRLQAGVSVNVQEFVREQKLLFQSEITADETEGATASAPDALPSLKDTAFMNVQQLVESAPLEALSKDTSVCSPSPDQVLAPQAINCGRAEKSLNLATSRRRRQPAHSLTSAPLSRDTPLERGLEKDSVTHGPEEAKRHRTVEANDQRTEKSSQTGLQKAGWRGYGAGEHAGRAPGAGMQKARSELKIAVVETHDSFIQGFSTNRDTSKPNPTIHGSQPSIEAPTRRTSPAHGADTHTLQPNKILEAAMSSGEPSYSTAPRLAKRSRRTAERAVEPNGVVALLPPAPLSSEGACTCSTEKSLQLWAAALKYVMQEEENSNTERVKSHNYNTIASALVAILTRAKRAREKACSTTTAPPPSPLAIVRSVCDSCTTATSPSVHPESPGHPQRPGGSDKGGMQHQSYASFSAPDCSGRRSSTTSSAESRSSRGSAVGETKDEDVGSPQTVVEPSVAFHTSNAILPEKRSLKLWRRESFTEKVLLSKKVSQLERVDQRKQGGFGAGDRRVSVTSAVSGASPGVDSYGKTPSAEETCSPKDRPHGSTGMLDLSGTLGALDVVDSIPNGTCTDADGPDTESDVYGSQTALVGEYADSVVTAPIPHFTMGDKAAFKDDCQEKCALRSWGIGDVFASAPTDPYPDFSDCDFASAASAMAAEVGAARHAGTTHLSVQRKIKQKNIHSQELSLQEDVCLAPDCGQEGWMERFRARVPVSYETCVAFAAPYDTEADGQKGGSDDERPTAMQPLATELLPLVKALCLMLVDLLRFCSWSPAALTRAGLQPSQVAFCRNEGRQVLHTALQDVSATRFISPRFRAYIEVFEDSILTNALPTSGSVAAIMYYICRVKHLTDRKGCRTEQAHKKSTQELRKFPKCGKGTVAEEHADKCHAGKETGEVREYSVALHADCHPHELRNCTTRNERLTTILAVGREEECESDASKEGERDFATKAKSTMQPTTGGEKCFSEFSVSSSFLPSGYPAQLCGAEEVKDRSRTKEEQSSLGKDDAFASCCVEDNQLSNHDAQPSDQQIEKGNEWVVGRGRAANSAIYYAARGVEDREARCSAGCLDSPKATRGENLCGEEENDHVSVSSGPDDKALLETADTKSKE